METDRLVQGFIDLTLPKAEWTHEAHLQAGLWHALRYTEPEALALLRERIRAYNVAVGGTNTDHSGYHETITRFYIRIIGAFVGTCDRARAIDDLARELIIRWGDRNLLLRYYTPGTLESAAARLSWVEPDRAPLGF